MALRKTVPDTITSWMITAFSVDPLYGLGLLEYPRKVRNITLTNFRLRKYYIMSMIFKKTYIVYEINGTRNWNILSHVYLLVLNSQQLVKQMDEADERSTF